VTWLQSYIANWNWWEAVGWLGQLMFFSRFLVQWIVSEKQGRSVIPFHFWTLSIAGSLLLLIYVTQRNAVPLIVGQAVGIFIYVRNVVLLKREACPRPAGPGDVKKDV